MEIVSVPVIFSAVLSIMQVYKSIIAKSAKVDILTRIIPAIAVVLGAVLGVVIFYAFPDYIPAGSYLAAVIIGGVSGWAATGAHQTVNQHA